MEGSAASRLPGLRQRAESRAVDAAARAYARLRPRTRALLLRGPQRPLVLRRIFKAMERQLDPERGARANVVLHWEIARRGGGADRWQLVVADGRCRASRRLDREPTATLKLDDGAFLDLVTGSLTGPALYMSGRLRVEGDPMRVASLTSAFRMPRPAPSSR